jgi:arylsulfatase A-like enzyme
VNWNAVRAPDALVTLAERMRDGGYETVGFSENSWLSNAFNVNQGFERFELITPKVARLPGALARWLRERRARNEERPFFLFVNVVDAHAPYAVRESNPFLPEGVSADEARAVSQEKADYMCAEGRERDLAILRGLYLGGVRAADDKLSYLLTVLGGAGLADDLVVVVTSDHGEHFGEGRRIEHVAGLDEPLIRIPLVVHGLKGAASGVIEQPVGLTAVAPSVLAWAGLEALPDAQQTLPLAAAKKGGPGLVAEWTDPVGGGHAPDPDDFVKVHRMMSRKFRAACSENDRVFGDQSAIVRHPWKLTGYEKHAPELHDLRAPWGARKDVSAEHPGIVAELVAELERRLEASAPLRNGAPAEPLPKEVEEGLRALGYLE